jgi:DnaJ-class molecular chaperone
MHQETTAAYDFLSDPDKRRKYDRGEIDENGQPRGFRSSNARPAGGPQQQQRRSRGFGFGYEDDAEFSEDLFGDFFGFGKDRNESIKLKGADVSYQCACRSGAVLAPAACMADGKTPEAAAARHRHRRRCARGQGPPGRRCRRAMPSSR